MLDSEAVAAYLESKSVGVQAQSIFIGLKVTLPSGDGPYLSILDTGGSAPQFTHNGVRPGIRNPTFQVVCRAKTYLAAMTMARNAYNALSEVRNTLLSGVYFLRIVPIQEPFDLGADETGRPKVAFNIHCNIRSA